MNRKFLGITFVGLLYGIIPVEAQPKFVTLPNGGMVPCDHPLAIAAGLGCTNLAVVSDYECDSPINPYREPDRAAFCSTFDPRPRNSAPFRIGERYYHPYGSKMIVLGTVRDINNNEIVVMQIYEGPEKGMVFTLINITNHSLVRVPDSIGE